jgi:hypothetical protein
MAVRYLPGAGEPPLQARILRPPFLALISCEVAVSRPSARVCLVRARIKPGGGGGLDRRENSSVRPCQTSRLFGFGPNVERAWVSSIGGRWKASRDDAQPLTPRAVSPPPRYPRAPINVKKGSPKLPPQTTGTFHWVQDEPFLRSATLNLCNSLNLNWLIQASLGAGQTRGHYPLWYREVTLHGGLILV